jgi:hypothetical protein
MAPPYTVHFSRTFKAELVQQQAQVQISFLMEKIVFSFEFRAEANPAKHFTRVAGAVS